MKNKAQISMEFLFGIGFLLFLFLIISAFVLNRTIELNALKDFVEKKNECFKVANFINSVYVGGDGTEINFKSDYIITLLESSSISIQDVDNLTELSATGTDVTCRYSANASYNVLGGKISIKNSNNVLIFKNDTSN